MNCDRRMFYCQILLNKLTLEDTAVATGNDNLGEVALDHFLTGEDILHVDLVAGANGVSKVVSDTAEKSLVFIGVDEEERKRSVREKLAEYKSVVT